MIFSNKSMCFFVRHLNEEPRILLYRRIQGCITVNSMYSGFAELDRSLLVGDAQFLHGRIDNKTDRPRMLMAGRSPIFVCGNSLSSHPPDISPTAVPPTVPGDIGDPSAVFRSVCRSCLYRRGIPCDSRSLSECDHLPRG